VVRNGCRDRPKYQVFAERLPLRAKMAQKQKTHSFLEKSADQRISAHPCFDRPIFRKLVFFRAFVACSSRLQTLCKQRENRASQAQKHRKKGVRGTGSSPAAAAQAHPLAAPLVCGQKNR